MNLHRVDPVVLETAYEARDAIKRTLAAPGRIRLFAEFRRQVLATNPYPEGHERRNPWRHAAVTQLVSVRFGTWEPLR